MLVDDLLCRGGRSEESLLERRAVRILAARRMGTFLKIVKERALPLVEDVEIDSPGCAFERLLCPWSLAALGLENFRGFIDACKDGDSSRRALDEQCLHQSGKALEHN